MGRPQLVLVVLHHREGLGRVHHVDEHRDGAGGGWSVGDANALGDGRPAARDRDGVLIVVHARDHPRTVRAPVSGAGDGDLIACHQPVPHLGHV